MSKAWDEPVAWLQESTASYIRISKFEKAGYVPFYKHPRPPQRGPEQDIDALRADAERYRWLREQSWHEASMCVVLQPKGAVRLGFDCPTLGRLDNVIDAAMQEKKNT